MLQRVISLDRKQEQKLARYTIEPEMSRVISRTGPVLAIYDEHRPRHEDALSQGNWPHSSLIHGEARIATPLQ